MTETTAPTPNATLDPEVVRVAAAVIVGALAVVFDTTIVSVALPTLARDLNAPLSTIQWVSTGYLLALGVAIPLAGWAQSRFGGKRLWLFALTVFLVGSVLCSLAWDASSLIAFRVVQGVGGGLMQPLMSTLVMQAAHGQNLGRIMSAVSLPAVLGPVLGPVIGGLILNSLDWRFLFWVNVPFCVVGFILAWRLLRPDARSAPIRLDTVGLLLLSPGLVAVLYALSNVGNDGGFSRTDVLLPLLAGVALLAGFGFWAVRRAGAALVDVRLLRHRPVASASALLFLSGASLYGAMLLLPLYWQEIRGFDALGAGLLLVPQGIGTFFSRSTAGRLTDRFGAKWVTFVGFAIVGAATIPFALSTASTNEWMLGAALLVRGFGLGAVTIPLMAVAFIGLERPEIPHASILTRIATQIGGAAGVAVLAVILEAAVSAAGPGVAAAATAFDQAFLWAIGFTVLAMALSFALPGRPSAVESKGAPAGAAPATTLANRPSAIPAPTGTRPMLEE